MARSTSAPALAIEQQAPNVHTLRFGGIRAGWEQWFLLSSDRHHDNIHCDQELERRHLEQVKERQAIIFDFGDLFCAMQGKWDPRASMDDLRPEHKRSDYLDALVETAAEFYGPYAAHFAVLGKGNHETSILSKHGADLTGLLAHRLRSERGARCFAGGYGGWIRLHFEIQKTVRETKRLKYHHGYGGGGPVTRGVIDTNRQAVYQPDADIVVNGHVHENYILPIARERLNVAGKVEKDLVWFVRTPTYKDEYGGGEAGYHIEKGRGPKPIGAVWMRTYYRDGRIDLEFTAAVR